MSYITLGNLTRFLNKLKTYIDNNYLKLTGGTVTGSVNFIRDITANSVNLRSVAQEITLISNDDGNMAKKQKEKFYAFLDEKNYTEYVPKLDGTGATGTWGINISGNALNDSNGNKIVDTYAKKSEVSAPDLTPYMKKNADSDLTMNNHIIDIGDSSIDGSTGDFVIQTTGGVEIITGGNNMHLNVNGDAVATQNYVKANYVPLSNGHISINGSELWIE